MAITTKKIQLKIVGDNNEKNRVYTYLRDGIYNQHLVLNTYMSQVGTLYYSVNGDIKSVEWKEKYNEIFRNTNEQVKVIPYPKGLNMQANAGRKVQADFSTALKNGLASGERQLPYYKKDVPLIVPSRFLHFYSEEETYEKDGIKDTRNAYYIKFVNGIVFKVVIGPSAIKDFYFLPLLDGICNNPLVYDVRGSSIQIAKGNKIILNLTVAVNKHTEDYTPIKGRTMGVAFGYNRSLTVALSDDDNTYYIGDKVFGKNINEEIISKRIELQDYRTRLQKSVRGAKGGHGRTRKIEALDKFRRSEKNMVKHYNHILSKEVVNFAKNHNVEAIIFEDVDKDDLKDNPVMLRNWSYYELCNFIKYKAKSICKNEDNEIKVLMANANGIVEEKKKKKKKDKNASKEKPIEVKTEKNVKEDDTDKIRTKCHICGFAIRDKDRQKVSKVDEWISEQYFTCPNCDNLIEYSYNKAKNMSLLG